MTSADESEQQSATYRQRLERELASLKNAQRTRELNGPLAARPSHVLTCGESGCHRPAEVRVETIEIQGYRHDVYYYRYTKTYGHSGGPYCDRHGEHHASEALRFIEDGGC